MSQITITLTNNAEQERFSRVLARTVDIAAATTSQEDAMITVHTERRFDHILKTISCVRLDTLFYFISAYEERVYHA